MMVASTKALKTAITARLRSPSRSEPHEHSGARVTCIQIQACADELIAGRSRGIWPVNEPL